MTTKLLGIIHLIAAISANSSRVAVLVSCGAMYVLSSTALKAGVFAMCPKSLNNTPLQIGASPAIVYLLSCTSESILSTTVSLVVCSSIAPLWSSTTCTEVALWVCFFPVT